MYNTIVGISYISGFCTILQNIFIIFSRSFRLSLTCVIFLEKTKRNLNLREAPNRCLQIFFTKYLRKYDSVEKNGPADSLVMKYERDIFGHFRINLS